MREGWNYKKLGEVCTIIGRIGFRGYKRTDYVESENEGAISLSPSNIIDGKLDYSKNTYITWEKYEESPEIKIFDGDVLLVKTASVGKSAIVRNLPHEATINPQFVVFKNIITNNEYLAYVIKSVTFLRQLQQITSGSSVPTLSQKALAELIIPLPPKSQQEAIVSELDEINSLLALKREQLQKYDKLAQSLFYEMFGDPVENEKGWEVKKLGEITSFYNGKAHENIIDEEGRYILVNSKFIASSASVFKKTNDQLFPLITNDIVMVMSDVPNGKALAKCFLVNENDKYSLNQRICAFRGYSLNPIYFISILNRNQYFLQFDDGDSQTNLRKNDILNCPIILPPLSLQQQFASRIEQIESQKLQVQAAIEKLETLLASRMQYWFE